jgi:hypothetical protein
VTGTHSGSSCACDTGAAAVLGLAGSGWGFLAAVLCCALLAVVPASAGAQGDDSPEIPLTALEVREAAPPRAVRAPMAAGTSSSASRFISQVEERESGAIMAVLCFLGPERNGPRSPRDRRDRLGRVHPDERPVRDVAVDCSWSIATGSHWIWDRSPSGPPSQRLPPA